MATQIEPFYLDLGKLIQGFRIRAEMTQAVLGSRLRPTATRANVANIENGKQRVLVHTLVEIADALGVQLVDLIPKTSNRKSPPPSLENELAEKLSISKHKARQMATSLRLR